MPGGNTIGNIWSAWRIDGSMAEDDVVKAAGPAGEKGGKTLGEKFKASFTKANVGKGLMAGLGFGAGLTAFELVKDGVSAVAGAITDTLDAAKQFDDQLRTINTVAGVSDAQLKRIGDGIQELSRETGQTTDDLTAGFYDLVSAGVPAADAMDVLKNSAILAVGALGTTSETVDLLTTTLNAYGIKASDSARVTDIFAKAVADGKLTAAELGKSMAQIAPIAASAGVSLEEVAAGYAQLTKNGVPAAQAATQMRAAISALLTPNAELAKIQKDVNVNFAEMARSEGLAKALDALRTAAGSDESLAKALGSVEALGATLLITGDNAGAFADELKGVEDAADKGGTALGQYKEKAKSAAEQQKRLDAEVKTLQQDIGELIQPIYSALIGGASLVVQTIRDLGDAFHNLQRFLDRHMATVEDEDKILIDLAQKYGINEDALLSYADAQRKAADYAKLSAQAVQTVQDAIGDVPNEIKDPAVAKYLQGIIDIANQAGVSFEEVWRNAESDINQFGLSVDTVDSKLEDLAKTYGVAAPATQDLATSTANATAYLNEFLKVGDASTATLTSLAAGAIAAGEGIGEGLARGIDMSRYKVGLALDDVQKQLRDDVTKVVAAYASYLRDHAARIELPHSASILEQIKKDLRQAAKDLQWELDHPGAWDKLTSTIQARIRKLMARAQEEDDKGNTHQAEIIQRGVANLIGIWEQATGLSWEQGIGLTEQYRRGTQKDLNKVETAAKNIKHTTIDGLKDPAAMELIGQDSIIKYADGIKSERAMIWLDYALGEVANHVSNFLETHSPAKEGPLSEGGGPEGYGLNLVRGLASGMLSGIPDLAAASSLVAGSLLPGLTYPMLPSYSAGMQSLSWAGEQTIRHVVDLAPGTVRQFQDAGMDAGGILAALSDVFRGAADSAHIGSLKPRAA